MNIIHEPSPNYPDLRKRFGVDFDKGLVISYFPNIHCKTDIPEDLVAHEQMHLIQQEKMGVEAWWEKYLEDPMFRLTEETAAYVVQAKFLKQKLNRQQYRERIRKMATDMVVMYGGMCTKEQAITILKQ